MKTITFVRHGQSTANAGGVTMPNELIPLSALGEKQAQALANALVMQPSGVWVSNYLRTQQTSQAFCKKVSATPIPHELLHEFSFIDPAQIVGLTGDQRWPLVQAYWQAADPHQRLGARAETFAEFAQRVRSFLPTLEQLPHNTLVFGHGTWLAMLAWQLMGFSAIDDYGMRAFRAFQQGLPMPNCGVYRFQQTPLGNWRAEGDEGIMRTVLAVAA